MTHTFIARYFDMDRPGMLTAVLFHVPDLAALGSSQQLTEWYIVVGSGSALMRRRKLSERLLDRGGELAQQLGDPITISRGLVYRAVASHFLGDTVEVDVVPSSDE